MPRIVAPTPVPPVLPIKVAIIVGIDIREEAKITGITPAVFTFSGIWLDWPPTIFLPCIFFAYCTGILLSASFRRITRIIVTIITARMMIPAKAPFATVLFFTKSLNRPTRSFGTLERILIIRTIEIPFPIPFSVIRSPTHIRNAEPAVRAVTTDTTFRKFILVISPWLPNPIAIARPSINASATVT